ncbi:MAG TPA: LUD domain-containing protein [Actinocrinis sp.]|nr:LUD domain-containing protein [Actinocrinis sp.]
MTDPQATNPKAVEQAMADVARTGPALTDPSRPGSASTDARTEIMARIRAALADRPAPPAAARTYQRSSSASHSETIDLFTERVADYRATVESVTEQSLPAAIAAALAARGVRRLVVPVDLPPEWLRAAPDVDQLPDEPALSVQDLDAADGVLTGAALGIALTGTIVLDAGPAQGRRALTLLPDYHLCVVRADQIVATVPEALAGLDPARPQTWISGPSATSDIELDRVEGVHGPRTLHVLVVRAEA